MGQKAIDGRIDGLFEAVLSLRTVDECYRFFEDLCTIPEILAMNQRLAVAKLLRKKTVYSEIVEKTGASTATISRVSRAYNYGADGYKTVLDRIEGEPDAG